MRILATATACAILLAAASPDAAGAIGGLAKVFTEGNSAAKSIGLLFLAFAFFSLKTLLPKNMLARFEGGRTVIRPLFFAAVALGFFAGVAAQLYVQASLGGGPGSYFSLVTDCQQNTCWEAAYFQHIHVMKSGVYFFEKTTGILLPANTDDGRPMYEMLASPALGIADFVAVTSFFLLAAILLLTFAAGLAEKEGWKSALVALAGFVSLLAVLDGGFFSLAGTTALALLLIILAEGMDLKRLDAAKPFIVLAVALFCSWAPYWFLGTGLYFREWLTAPLFVCSAYFFSRQKNKKNWLFVAAAVLLAASSLVVLSDASRNWLGETSPAGKMLAYGIPVGATEAQITRATGASLVGRYGWYALLEYPRPFNTAVEQQRLRQALAPTGYLLAEAAGKPPAQTDVDLVWLSAPVEVAGTASYSGVSQMQFGPLAVLRGTSALQDPQLALELGSYIRSKGGKAIVVTEVI